jgi:phage terminase Nu1 subunit (DNA packaging protein)
LRGCSRTAVEHRIALGALPTSAKRIKGKWRIVDPARANREWETNTTPLLGGNGGNGSHGSGPSALAAALLRARTARAEAIELETARKRGEWVPIAEVTARWSSLVVEARTQLLGLPTRARQRLPHLSAADVRVLDGLVREALESLARGSAAHPKPGRESGE